MSPPDEPQGPTPIWWRWWYAGRDLFLTVRCGRCGRLRWSWQRCACRTQEPQG